MAKRDQLRVLRLGMVINKTSMGQEKDVGIAVQQAIAEYQEQDLPIKWQGRIYLTRIVGDLQKGGFEDIEFAETLPNTYMQPDGGIVSLLDENSNLYPILIAEVKHQGTNEQRVEEGKPKQAPGNAVERLGKNVVGFRTWLFSEQIFPFICFGYGCDFSPNSPILDRVKTINQFGPLNTTIVERQGRHGEFQRGSFYFREEQWAIQEMKDVVLDVMSISIAYYLRKYGVEKFQKGTNA